MAIQIPRPPARREILTAYLLFYFTFRALVQVTMLPEAPSEALPVLGIGLAINAAAVYAVAKRKAYWGLLFLCWVHLLAGVAYSWVDGLMSLFAVVAIHQTRARFKKPGVRPSTVTPLSAAGSSSSRAEEKQKRAA